MAARLISFTITFLIAVAFILAAGARQSTHGVFLGLFLVIYAFWLLVKPAKKSKPN